MPAKNQLKDMLFLFVFNVPLAEFASMLWVIILHEYKSLTNKVCSRWDCVMLQYALIVSLIQFALHLKEIPDFAICNCHYNRASSMPYVWCDTGGCSSFTNSSLHIDPPIWAKDFKLWFISPKNFIPLLYCPIFVYLGPLEPFDILLLPLSWHQFCHIIIIIIIITSPHQHGYSWSSLATLLYSPLLPAGLQGYILYQHRAAVCRF